MFNNVFKSCHIILLLKKLHWLPVRQKFSFKIQIQSPNCLQGFGI